VHSVADILFPFALLWYAPLQAQDTDEVTFVEGDLVVGVQPGEDGWVSGVVVRTGVSGAMPAAYIQVQPAAAPAPAAANTPALWAAFGDTAEVYARELAEDEAMAKAAAAREQTDIWYAAGLL